MREFIAICKNQNLEPFLSAETIRYHYGKHHVGYANTLNSLIQGTEFENLSLDEIISKSHGVHQKIFNNAAQLFNHNFYWQCLRPSVELPNGKLSDMIRDQFGNFGEFQNQYIAFASTMFGSGWSWLVEQNEELKFVNTQNAEIPYEDDVNLVCVVDLWEHAYYIDYRNDRAQYLNETVKNCIDWEFCSSKVF